MPGATDSGRPAHNVKEHGGNPTLRSWFGFKKHIAVEGGMDTAASIPGAELLIIEGMGHGIPEGAWPQIIDGISALTSKA
jgi:pimeloyl-ACP methyl ester carboxylesterase